MTCHVVGAKVMSADVTKMITPDDGADNARTDGGYKLTLKADGCKVTVTDENGNVANVTIAYVEQSNGGSLVIDNAPLSKM